MTSSLNRKICKFRSVCLLESERQQVFFYVVLRGVFRTLSNIYDGVFYESCSLQRVVGSHTFLATSYRISVIYLRSNMQLKVVFSISELFSSEIGCQGNFQIIKNYHRYFLINCPSFLTYKVLRSSWANKIFESCGRMVV